MTRIPHRTPGGGASVGLGAAVAAVVCCAGAPLLATGALAGVATALRSPVTILFLLLLLGAAATVAVRRVRRRRHCISCQAPHPPGPHAGPGVQQ